MYMGTAVVVEFQSQHGNRPMSTECWEKLHYGQLVILVVNMESCINVWHWWDHCGTIDLCQGWGCSTTLRKVWTSFALPVKTHWSVSVAHFSCRPRTPKHKQRFMPSVSHHKERTFHLRCGPLWTYQYTGVAPRGQTHNFKVCGMLYHSDLSIWHQLTGMEPISNIDGLLALNAVINTLVT